MSLGRLGASSPIFCFFVVPTSKKSGSPAGLVNQEFGSPAGLVSQEFASPTALVNQGLGPLCQSGRSEAVKMCILACILQWKCASTFSHGSAPGKARVWFTSRLGEPRVWFTSGLGEPRVWFTSCVGDDLER